MRFIQIVPTLSFGDAVGNHIMTMYRETKKRGIETYIYADQIDTRLKDYVSKVSEYQNEEQDIILYHFSVGSPLNREVVNYKGKIIFNYHNITPPEFFKGYSHMYYDACKSAYDDFYYLADKVKYVVGDSKYNIDEMKKNGYKSVMTNIPINIQFNDYDIQKNQQLFDSLKDGYKNIVFVGRVAPNKRQEKIIEDFFCYNENFNKNSRLIIVGNYKGMEKYYFRLQKFIKKNHIKNVIFTGHISFQDIITYYHAADLFVCESKHEGFCVPLVEAMYFRVPIIAFKSSAIEETLGKAGILHEFEDSSKTAVLMNEVLTNKELYKAIQVNQEEELKRFATERVMNAYFDFLGIE